MADDRVYKLTKEEQSSVNDYDDGQQNILVMNTGSRPMPNYNFMLRVEGLFDVPCKSVRAFTKENEFEYIREGGLNDYVHMKRKPVSKPFTFVVERYASLDYVDPLTLGTEIALPVILLISRYENDFGTSKRSFTFTGCTVIAKEYGELNAERSGLLTENTTISYREMICFDIPAPVVDDAWKMTTYVDDPSADNHKKAYRYTNETKKDRSFAYQYIYWDKTNKKFVKNANILNSDELRAQYAAPSVQMVESDEEEQYHTKDANGNPTIGTRKKKVPYNKFKSRWYFKDTDANHTAASRAMKDNNGVITPNPNAKDYASQYIKFNNAKKEYTKVGTTRALAPSEDNVKFDVSTDADGNEIKKWINPNASKWTISGGGKKRAAEGAHDGEKPKTSQYISYDPKKKSYKFVGDERHIERKDAKGKPIAGKNPWKSKWSIKKPKKNKRAAQASTAKPTKVSRYIEQTEEGTYKLNPDQKRSAKVRGGDAAEEAKRKSKWSIKEPTTNRRAINETAGPHFNPDGSKADPKNYVSKWTIRGGTTRAPEAPRNKEKPQISQYIRQNPNRSYTMLGVKRAISVQQDRQRSGQSSNARQWLPVNSSISDPKDARPSKK